MSGGFDSSVAAALLARQGHYVIGLSMQLYDQREGTASFGSCFGATSRATVTNGVCGTFGAYAAVTLSGTSDATSAPGNTSVRPLNCAPLAEILKLNGYSTAQFGKCHEVPVWETSPMGPFDRWPTGSGFEYFYGFIGGETHQYYPALYEGTIPVELFGRIRFPEVTEAPCFFSLGPHDFYWLALEKAEPAEVAANWPTLRARVSWTALPASRSIEGTSIVRRPPAGPARPGRRAPA